MDGGAEQGHGPGPHGGKKPRGSSTVPVGPAGRGVATLDCARTEGASGSTRAKRRREDGEERAGARSGGGQVEATTKGASTEGAHNICTQHSTARRERVVGGTAGTGARTTAKSGVGDAGGQAHASDAEEEEVTVAAMCVEADYSAAQCEREGTAADGGYAGAAVEGEDGGDWGEEGGEEDTDEWDEDDGEDMDEGEPWEPDPWRDKDGG